MADQLTEAQIQEFAEAFQLFDADGSGTIDLTELGTVLRSLGQNPKEAELQRLINDVDVDKNGSLDFPEFLAVMVQQLQTRDDPEKKLKEAFKILDADGSGSIGMEEMKRMLTTRGDKMTEEEVDEVFKLVDLDGDGTIEFDEFMKVLLKY
eukprot:TRINITY_DN7923_c0_g1_i1.p2 TRINITY_DN7923_c0_g1~~TRINITY_DN7923_c0_g1_i1.p2  ORF type:complete len:151 (-),score=59.22 TRINITY_DN7923_c0_g1_i1:208-660(-)